MSLDIVILAAGQGTRMHSSLPKVMHPIAGKPMLAHLLDTARQLQPSSIQVVVGHGAEQVEQNLAAEDIGFVLQRQQLGTGHAVLQALPYLQSDLILVLYGDVPLIKIDTLQRLLAKASPSTLALLTVELDEPSGYGRIVRGVAGVIEAIVEHKDASAEQLKIKEINTGILVAPRSLLDIWLKKLSNQNAQGEYYLTDIISMAAKDGFKILSEQPQTAIEVQGVNNRFQLAQLERFYQRTQANTLMLQGVTLADPERFDIRGSVQVGRDVFIDINVILEGQVIIEDNVIIESNCVIKDSILRKGSRIRANSHVEGAEVGEKSECGPFARLRPGSILDSQVHIGNFVEIKNTFLGEGVKAGHLTYLGDARIGTRSNIGAGTITCNYDGENKHLTVVGEDVFIGSNNSLVAPLSIGSRATTGAGSTLTETVSVEMLALGRARQKNISGWQRPSKNTLKNPKCKK